MKFVKILKGSQKQMQTALQDKQSDLVAGQGN